MRSRMLRKTTALVMTVLLVLTTVLSVMPVSAFATTAAQTSVLPGESARVRTTGGVSHVSTDNAITVTATAAGKAVITPDSASVKTFDMTQFNGLSMAVNSNAEFKLSLTFFSMDTYSSVTLSSADGDFNRVLPQLDAYIPAGAYSGAMDMTAAFKAKNSTFDAADMSSVYLSAVTVETDAAATVTISALDVAEYSTKTGKSLLTGTPEEEDAPVSTALVDNVYSLTSSDDYGRVRFRSTVTASLYASLHYNFTIENEAADVESATISVFVQYGGDKECDFKLNCAITQDFDHAVTAMGAGHYEGTVSMADVQNAYNKYCEQAEDVTEQDIVNDGIITITGVSIHLAFGSGGTVDVYDLSVSEPEAVAAPSLMPSSAQVAENDITMKDGWIVLSGDEGDTVSYTLDTYYNIKEYDYLAANVVSNTAYDIIVTGEGAGNSTQTLKSINTRNGLSLSSGKTDGDWWSTDWGVSTNNVVTTFQQAFIGAPEYHAVINANNMYHITKITIVLGGKGTVKISALRMTTAEDTALMNDGVTFSVGTAEGEAGDIVNVPVYLESTSGVANFDMKVSFDKELLTPVANTDGTCGVWNQDMTNGAWKIAADQGDGSIKVVFASSKNSAIGGQLFYIPFKISDNAGLCTTSVQIEARNVCAVSDINPDDSGAADLKANAESGLVLIGCDDPAVTNISVTTTTTTTTTVAPANVTVSVVTVSEAVKSDDVIAVDVVIDGESGLSNFTLDVKFDSTQLTPVQQDDAWAVWNADVLGNAVAAEGEDTLDNAMTAANYNTSADAIELAFVTARRNTAAEGVLATVYFKVNSDIKLDAETVTATAGITLGTHEVQYYDAQSGYRTPIVTTVDDFVTVYPTLTVQFYDTDGTLVATQDFVNDDGSIDVSTLDTSIIPEKLNYARIGWKETSASSEGVVAVEPIYGYTVETINGVIVDTGIAEDHWLENGTMAYFNDRHTASESILGYNNTATIKANAAPDGQQFSHWEDQHGNVVSYEEEYTIFVPGNLTLTAIYVDELVVIDYKPTVAMQIVRGVYDEEKETASITWVCDLNDELSQEKYTVVEAGIIYGVKNATYEDLKNETKDLAKKVTIKGVSIDSHQYSVTIQGVQKGNHRKAIAYAVYTDGDNKVTVYSAETVVLGMTAAADM